MSGSIADIGSLEFEQRSDNQVVRSNIFAATIVRAGVKQRFQELQNLLLQISAAEADIRAYGSGEIFNDLIAEFEIPGSNNPFDDQTLFGSTDPPMSMTVIDQTRRALRRVTNAMAQIKSAIKLISDIYDWVNNQVKNLETEFISIELRTEDLLAWAYRKGARLRPDITGIKRLSLQTRATPATTNLLGLLNLLDDLLLELQTLLNIPAYYRTATDSDTSKIKIPVKTVYVKRGESIERLAFRELGDADKASLIMEFNDLKPSDIMGDDWDGRALDIPYIEAVDNDRLRSNFVLDSQAGINVLGRDLPNELSASKGDLELLNFTNTLFQSIENIIQTPVGAIPEQPEYGNNLLQLRAGGIPQLVGAMAAVEVQRALMTNPRVVAVTNVRATRDKDAYRVKFQITPVNHLTEVELEANLELT